MKANAPERVYLQPSVIEQLPHQNIVYTKPLADNSIEYVRKDAFVDKAAEWLSEIENGTTITDIDKFVEDFKKAMKL